MEHLSAFRIQWLEWLLAFVCIFLAWKPRFATRLRHIRWDHGLLWLPLAFFALSSLAKILQLWCLDLNAQDFWLFVDLFDNAKDGHWMITHFGPQSYDPVQHGAIHPFLPFWIFLPFTYLFGSAAVALFLNPIALSASGFFLGQVCRRLGLDSFSSFAIVLAYLLSKQVSLSMMYETHPECLYPLLGFWLLDAVLAKRFTLVALLGFLLGSLKEDSFLVLFPSLAALFIFAEATPLAIAAASGALGYWVQILLLHYFSLHPEGGVIAVNTALAPHAEWNSWSGILSTMTSLLSQFGGIQGLVRQVYHFFISDSVRGLVLNAPWVLLSPLFWISLLPQLIGFSLRGEQAILWNYYSAPFLVGLWFTIAVSLRKKSLRWLFICVALSLCNGSESVYLLLPNSHLAAFRAEAESIVDQIPPTLLRHHRVGWVPGGLLSFVPLESIYTNHVPTTLEQLGRLEFLFFPLKWNRYDLNSEQAAQVQALVRSTAQFDEKISEHGNFILFTRHPVLP